MGGIRVYALDGLRGWAAMLVCAFHVFVDMFRGSLPELASPIVTILLNGSFPVAVFFVLSGYVLTSNGWRAPKTPVIRQMIKRYPRLLIPILATAIVVFALMASGVTRHAEALPVFGTEWWIRGTIFQPAFADALSFASFWAFSGMATDQNYQPFLWTMTYELIGSLLVLGICLCERGGKVIYYVLGGLALLLFAVLPLMSAFCFGALLSLLKADRLLPDVGKWAWPAVIVCVLVQGVLHENYASVAAATGVLLAALSTSSFNRALTSRVSQWFGRISFPIYLMQWPVIITVTSALGLLVAPLTVGEVIGIGVVSVMLTLVAAQAFYPVEQFTTWACRRIGRLVPEPRRLEAKL